jgi:hypothetical protein
MVMEHWKIINKGELTRCLEDNLPEFKSLSRARKKKIVDELAYSMGSINFMHDTISRVRNELREV